MNHAQLNLGANYTNYSSTDVDEMGKKFQNLLKISQVSPLWIVKYLSM